MTLPWAKNLDVVLDEFATSVDVGIGPYTSLGLAGCLSHSGRRTFITRAARKVSEVGGSLRDVQQLAGHTSLTMTQRYIEGDAEAKRKLIALI